MEHSITCNECQAIAAELAEAFLEVWDSADRQTQEAWAACQKMLGGTEEDVQRAEELTERFPHRTNSDRRYLVGIENNPVFRAWRKKCEHEARSKHNVPFRKPW